MNTLSLLARRRAEKRFKKGFDFKPYWKGSEPIIFEPQQVPLVAKRRRPVV